MRSSPFFFVYVYFCSPRCFAICLPRVILIGFKRIIIENWVWCFGFFFSNSISHSSILNHCNGSIDSARQHHSKYWHCCLCWCQNVFLFDALQRCVSVFISDDNKQSVVEHIDSFSKWAEEQKGKKSKMLHSKQCDEQWSWHSVTLY